MVYLYMINIYNINNKRSNEIKRSNNKNVDTFI